MKKKINYPPLPPVEGNWELPIKPSYFKDANEELDYLLAKKKYFENKLK